MIFPPWLAKGDKIGIAATAKYTTPEEIAYGLQLVTEWGLLPVTGENIYRRHNFFAGSDKDRIQNLQSMLDDQEIKAIAFTKGAYGTLRIIDELDFTGFISHPKWITGYSDITVLHNHIHNLGIASIHSVMLQGMPGSLPAASGSLHDALFGLPLTYTIPAHRDNKNQSPFIAGIVTGGNLSMLHTLTGTPSDIDTRDKILFIEDIDEYRYHLDRMMIAMKRAGKLQYLRALVVGGMTDIKESTLAFGQDAHEIILEYTAHYGYPVLFGFPAGHMADNRAMILGSNLSIKTQNNYVTFEFST